MTGSDWSQTKMALDGLANVGTSTTCWNMNLMLNLMWVF